MYTMRSRAYCYILYILLLLLFALSNSANQAIFYKCVWFILQWIPFKTNNIESFWDSIRWKILERLQENELWLEEERGSTRENRSIPTVDVQKHRHNLQLYLQKTYGHDWRQRPVFFKGLWTKDELIQKNNGAPRLLSLENLLQMKLQIPYFSDASVNSLTPNHKGSVRDIVYNITMGKSHKIGTQLILEEYPDSIREVAPLNIVNDLFGNYFSSDRLLGSGPWNLFPAITTVPVFIAHSFNGDDGNSKSQPICSSVDHNICRNKTVKLEGNGNESFTPLHCEPIGNIAVQLSGQKKWTLVQPEYSFQIKPGLAPDGRAFFASWGNESDYENVPTYSAITAAGDAIWVPPWTWHQVNYIESDEIAIGASLFHFRILDFIQNNALFAFAVVPPILKELLGFNTQ